MDRNYKQVAGTELAVAAVASDELVISPYQAEFDAATLEERCEQMAGLFVGLSSAIANGGSVDISDPNRIIVKRRRTINGKSQEHLKQICC